jgi:methanogenic corrinoid protein MtbC1
LRWVKAKIDSGMQTRQAVRALESLEAQPVPDFSSSGALSAMQTPITDISPSANSYLHVLQQRLQEALLRHNVEDADAVFNEAQSLYAHEDIIHRMIGPTLDNIGMGWEQGEVTVASEHFASHYLRQRLMTWMNVGPPSFNVPPTVLACSPGEYHEGGLMMFGALLHRRRWPVAYLGQSTPLVEVASFVKEVSPAAIVMTAMTEEPAAALAEWPEAMPEVAETQRPIFAFGGRIFTLQPEWRTRVPGVFLGTTLDEGVQKLENLLQQMYVPLE